MTNEFHLAFQVCPILLVPFLATILPVLSYFVHRKYQVRRQLRNVPYSTIFNIDLSKVKKNLEIESMVCNFILILLIIELSTNISWGITQFLEYDLNASRNQTLGSKAMDKTDLNLKEFLFISSLPTIIFSSILPILGLLLIVLRRTFINLPYKLWVWRYSVYISVRVVAMLAISLFLETALVLNIMFLPLALFDIRVYISSSRDFYVLLKGRRDEALYHSSRSDYLEKKRIANRFFYAQIITFFGLFAILLNHIYLFLKGMNDIRRHSALFEYISFGSLSKYDNNISHILIIMEVLSFILLQFYEILIYFLICVSIIIHLCARRKKFNHVNDWLTRPLMERYRSNLERGRTQERPPFIQAFRSHIVY